MIGLIDVGGGLRDIYGTGVLDYCLDNEIKFDLCIGVSAGSGNIASFLAKQKKRNYPFYTEYPQRKEFMSLRNILKRGEYMNLDYVYGELCREDGENPIDFETLNKYDGKFYVVATNAQTGKPHYFTKSKFCHEDLKILHASSTLPVFCKACNYNGTYFYDGGCCDPLPIEFAMKQGCAKVVVILTKPIDAVLDDKMDRLAGIILKKKFPNFIPPLVKRTKVYAEEVNMCLELQKKGRCLVVAPDDLGGVGRLTTDISLLNNLYQKGYTDAEKISDFLR